MSESRMIGSLDAKMRREQEIKTRIRAEGPMVELQRYSDGSESGVERYERTIVPDDGRESFTIRGTVRWWRSADAVRISKGQ
jgi:hypothetical protein